MDNVSKNLSTFFAIVVISFMSSFFLTALMVFLVATGVIPVVWFVILTLCSLMAWIPIMWLMLKGVEAVQNCRSKVNKSRSKKSSQFSLLQSNKCQVSNNNVPSQAQVELPVQQQPIVVVDLSSHETQTDFELDTLPSYDEVIHEDASVEPLVLTYYMGGGETVQMLMQ